MKFKNLKQTILATLLVFVAYSCQDNYEPTVKTIKPTETSTRIARNQFKSVDEMLAKMKELKQRGRHLKGRDNIIRPVDTVAGIDVPIVDIDGDLLNDGIIRYEYTNISSERLIKDGDMTYYEACGYDSLVPDTTFARVLNIKGEVQVADTVYKISRHGTYYFKANLEPYFTDNYSKYEQTEGTKIGDYLYLMDSVGIYRFDTFAKGRDEYAQDKDLPDDIEESRVIYTPPVNKSFASEVNWNNFPVYDADAKTFLGKVWQSIFGRNKSYYYNIAKKRRVRGKLYFYKYIVYEEIGATVELQKKNWVGWSGTKADKLTINWHNMVLEYKYPKPINDMPINKNIYCSVDYDKYIPSIDGKGKITTIFGLEMNKYLFDKICSKGAKGAFDILKSILGSKLPNNAADSNAFALYGENKFYVIIPDGYIDDVNTKKRHKIFHERWNFNITFSLTNMSFDWLPFAQSILNSSCNSPKLVYGEVRVGACLNNNWGAMTISKVDKKFIDNLK